MLEVWGPGSVRSEVKATLRGPRELQGPGQHDEPIKSPGIVWLGGSIDNSRWTWVSRRLFPSGRFRDRPWLTVQCRLEFGSPVHRVAVRDEDVLERQVEHRAQRRQCGLLQDR